MKKIMIMGSAGMLGHVVYKYFTESKKFHVINASFPLKIDENSYILDVTDKLAVEKYIRAEKPDILVNCIGVLIKGSKMDPANSIYLNSFFPHQLSKLIHETGGRLVHLSTDCVFSGKKGWYSETDFRDADDIYGRSKALGEVINGYDLTIRTSIIGPELKENGEGLLNWFLKQKGEINGYTMAFWSGVTTLEIAKSIEFAIEHDTRGLVHFTNGEAISKYSLLQLIRKIWNKNDIIINESAEKQTDKTLIRSASFKYNFPSYEVMLSDLKEWMDNHRELYKLV